MIKVRNARIVEVRDWNQLVSKTYGKIYCFQQQDSCRSRGIFSLTVPCSIDVEEEEMNDSIPEVVNGDIMGVKFDVWLERDPNVHNFETDWKNNLFWERNFYPSIYTVANDLYKKGLIEAGEYTINIDW